jgi:transposase
MSKPGQKVHNKVVFKEYNQNQLSLPIDLESLIPANHMVKVINTAIDRMKFEPLFAKYPGGGRASFHPVMMTKLIVYAYADKTYSSRRIEKADRENIMYIWLCGGNNPDFKTINTFRSERMKDIILDIFSKVVELLHKEGYIKLENYFMDGTKIVDVFLSQQSSIRWVKDPAYLEHLFLVRDNRKVKHDGTISIKNRLYEVPAQFIGQRIEVRFNASDIFIYQNGQPVTKAVPVNLPDNAFVKRERKVSFAGIEGDA